MRYDNLGKDKLGGSWVVFTDICPPAGHLRFTNVTFYVCLTSDGDVDKRIGKAALTIYDTKQSVAKIEDIVVNPSYRGRGIGSLLLDYLERWAIKENVKKLHGELVRVDIDHIGILKRFYKKHGFSFILNKKSTLDPTIIEKVEKIIS